MLACPSDEFGGQELDTAEEILKFVGNFNFLESGGTMLEKMNVKKGSDQHPLYNLLISSTTGKNIRWNFGTFANLCQVTLSAVLPLTFTLVFNLATKFLISPDAQHVLRYDNVNPADIEEDIVGFLGDGKARSDL